ncbi:MAG: hypothetical protein MAG794_00929 [Gammaproteobacteria bacterium]|nr:hypothetical protein [Gammaproteobacteria bacterium]
MPQVAHPAHIVPHNAVAALGHPRYPIAAPFRLKADPDESHVEWVGDRLYLGQVPVHFGARSVHVLQRFAGQLQLTSGFQGDRAPIAFQPDHVAGLGNRFPFEFVLQRTQQGLDPMRPAILEWTKRVPVKTELLVFGADTPFARRFAAGFKIGRKLRRGTQYVVLPGVIVARFFDHQRFPSQPYPRPRMM